MKTLGLILFAVAHGYFAAWLAVWMLFNPRSPKYLGTWKLPFTPGLLPASRKQIEISIAEAVSRQLLLPDVLEKAAIQQGLPKVIRSSIPEHIEELAQDESFMDMLVAAVAEIVKDYLRTNHGLKTELEERGLVPFGKPFAFNFDQILQAIWKQIEAAIEKACKTPRFKAAMEGAIRRIADDLRKDDSPLSQKVESLAGRMIGSAATALDVRAVVLDRLSQFSNEEIENLIKSTAGRQLQSIKNVAAMIGIMFGLLSALLFG